MKCYQIFFSDGSSVLRNAKDIDDAQRQVKSYLDEIQPLGDSDAGLRPKDVLCIDKVERLV